MIHAHSWNLVAAGPSRIHLRSEHLIRDMPVVTVNRALDVRDQGIKVHFAAFADSPDHIWKPLGMERHIIEDPSIQIWVRIIPKTVTMTMLEAMGPKGLSLPKEDRDQKIIMPGPTLMHLWDKCLPAYVGLRELPSGQVEDVNNGKCMRQAFTTLCALERIFMFRPERIRILCADMSGPWIDGMDEEECRQHEIKKVANSGGTVLDRWKHERTALDRSIKRAQDTWKLTVDWVQPEPAALAVS